MYLKFIRLYAILILLAVLFCMEYHINNVRKKNIKNGSIVIQDTTCNYYSIVGVPTMLDKRYLDFDFEDFDDSLHVWHGFINIGDYVRIYYDLNSDGVEDRVFFHKILYMYRSNDTLYHYPEKEYEFMYVDEDFDENWDWIFWTKGPYGEIYQIPFDRYKEWLDSLVYDLSLDKI